MGWATPARRLGASGRPVMGAATVATASGTVATVVALRRRREPDRDVLPLGGLLPGDGHRAVRALALAELAAGDPWLRADEDLDGRRRGQLEGGRRDRLGLPEVEDEPDAAEYADLLTWLGEELSDEVKQVRLSHRLTESAACMVGDEFDMTPQLEAMYRASGMELPVSKRILELNPTHPLVERLRAKGYKIERICSVCAPGTADLVAAFVGRG